MIEYYRPIPDISEPDQANSIRRIEEPLVDIESAEIRNVLVEPKYFINGLEGAISKIYVRKQVASMLEKAASILPVGLKLKIYDAWRPYRVQEVLYWNYYNLLKQNHRDLDREQLEQMTKLFVSYPSKDPLQPFVHSTGGAVDLTIIDENNVELNMGSSFDDFSEKSFTRYFEAEGNSGITENRRLLYNVMTFAGFTNLPTEWWHYDYGDNFWAFYNKTDAIYAGIYEVKF